MPTVYPLGTIKNAIKPVGEQLVIDYDQAQILGIGDTVQWDYELSSNYVVTDLELVKTADDANPLSTILVQIYAVDNTGSAVVIMSERFPLATNIGDVLRAGDAAAVVLPYANGGSTNLIRRLIGILSQARNVAGTANSQQLLRIKITNEIDDSAIGQASMMIKLSLARFSDISSKFDEVTTITG